MEPRNHYPWLLVPFEVLKTPLRYTAQHLQTCSPALKTSGDLGLTALAQLPHGIWVKPRCPLHDCSEQHTSNFYYLYMYVYIYICIYVYIHMYI